MSVKPIEILLVEDNPGDVFLTRNALQRAKLSNNLHDVKNGEEALAFLKQKEPFANAPRPDIILLDLNLPRMNGHEVLQAVKSDDALKDIPVIVLTTSSNKEDIINSYRHYANAYITKPVNIEQLIEVLQSFGQFWLTTVTLPSR